MVQDVLQALNPLSIHVTFTAIVPEAYPGETKCLKTAIFGVMGQITGKRDCSVGLRGR